MRAAIRDALGIRYSVADNTGHLSAAMSWLCAAQDATADGGVSAFYDVVEGIWAPSYPETTGYIIPTFFDYACFSGDDAYKTRAIRMADWLLTLQLDCGAFPMGPLWTHLDRIPMVFDTGQIIHGLVRAFEETGDPRYVEAANRAGDWLVKVQETDGSWQKFTFLGYTHTYNTRVAWALLQLGQVSQNETHRQGALRNLSWALTQQTPDGWFHNAGFRPDDEPHIHTIAYTISGLLESGALLADRQLIGAARLAADALRDRQAEVGYLRGTYGPGWQSCVNWSCLTGDVQMALVWFRLYEMTDDDSYLEAALKANHYVKQVQPRNSGLLGVDGGIAGSFPIYGGYHPYLYLNWAAKFFVDSLLLEERCRYSKEARDEES